jgi:hypothetical protein
MAPIKEEILCKDRKYSKQLVLSELETFVDDDDDDAPRTFRIMTTKKNMKKMIPFSSEHNFTITNFKAITILSPEVQMALHLYAFLCASSIKQ